MHFVGHLEISYTFSGVCPTPKWVLARFLILILSEPNIRNEPHIQLQRSEVLQTACSEAFLGTWMGIFFSRWTTQIAKVENRNESSH